jgi:predicted RNase H-like HicB family nuclease
MTLTVEIDRETDGRWIAEVQELPGVLAYGESREQAVNAAKALALHVLADRIEHGEEDGATVDTVAFVMSAAA